MINNKISSIQLFIIMFICRVITFAVNMPLNKFPEYSGNIWLSVIIKSLLSFILIFPYIIISSKQKYIDNIRKSRILNFVLFFYLQLKLVIICVQFANLMGDTVIPRMPVIFIIIPVCVFTVYASVKGIETIARMSQLLLPIMVTGVLIIIVLSYINADYLTLPDDSVNFSFGESFSGACFMLSNNYEAAVFLLLIPNLSNNKKIGIKYLKFNAIVCVFEIAAIGAMFVTFGKYIVNVSYPFFSIARNIRITRFFERFESIYLALWILGTFIVVALIYYLLKNTSKVGTNKIYIFLSGVLIVFTLYFTSSKSLFAAVSQSVWIWAASLIVVFTVPFLTMISIPERKSK